MPQHRWWYHSGGTSAPRLMCAVSSLLQGQGTTKHGVIKKPALYKNMLQALPSKTSFLVLCVANEVSMVGEIVVYMTILGFLIHSTRTEKISTHNAPFRSSA